MTWYMTTVGRPAWVPTTQDCQLMPQYKADAHRLFMSGRSHVLLRGTA